MNTHITLALALALTTAACVGAPEDQSVATLEQELSSGQGAVTLDFVNDQEQATFEVLDVVCELRSDSAKKIVRHRDGKDKVAFTSDDDLFDTVQELDDVAMVGPVTLQKLYDCAVLFDPNACTPEVCTEEVQYWGETALDYEEIWNEASLDSSWSETIAELAVDAEYYKANTYFPVTFGNLSIFRDNDVAVRYQVGFRQWIDPEGGVQLWIVYTLNSCREVIDIAALL